MTDISQVLVIRDAALDPCRFLEFRAVHPDRRSRGTGDASLRRRARLDRAGIPAYLKVDGPYDRDLSRRRPGAPRRPMVRRLGAPRRPMLAEVRGLHDRDLVHRFGAPRRPMVFTEVDGPHDRDLSFRPGVARRSVFPFPDRSPRRSRWRVPMRP